MQGWLEPRGELAPRVYWIRRAAVLAVLVALIVVVVAIGRALAGSSSDTTSASPSATHTPSLTPTPAASDPTASPTTDQTATESASQSPVSETSESPASEADPSTAETPDTALSVPVVTSPPPPPVCDASMLTATISGTEELKVTEEQKFTVTVLAETACSLDLAQIGAKVEVTSGSDAIWSTATCPQWELTGSWELEAGDLVTLNADWPTRRGHDCELSEDLLLPGTYVATATVGDTGKFVMRLTA